MDQALGLCKLDHVARRSPSASVVLLTIGSLSVGHWSTRRHQPLRNERQSTVLVTAIIRIIRTPGQAAHFNILSICYAPADFGDFSF